VEVSGSAGVSTRSATGGFSSFGFIFGGKLESGAGGGSSTGPPGDMKILDAEFSAGFCVWDCAGRWFLLMVAPHPWQKRAIERTGLPQRGQLSSGIELNRAKSQDSRNCTPNSKLLLILATTATTVLHCNTPKVKLP
jgi:hypothetical protein